MAQGRSSSLLAVAGKVAAAVGFLLVALLAGRILVTPLLSLARRVTLPGTVTIAAILLAFGLAWLADRAGSAVNIGAFAAALLLAETPDAHEVERGITAPGHFFVPLFFVAVGAAVDVRSFNPLDPSSRALLLTGGLLIAAAVAGKFLSGYSVFWSAVDRRVIGVGMIPRGEVGLIFAQMGLSSGVFNQGLYGAVTLMVIVTTFITPPLLKVLLADESRGRKSADSAGIEDLVMTP
jgi:Kef-type K+ transport system membrane component KefB